MRPPGIQPEDLQNTMNLQIAQCLVPARMQARSAVRESRCNEQVRPPGDQGCGGHEQHSATWHYGLGGNHAAGTCGGGSGENEAVGVMYPRQIENMNQLQNRQQEAPMEIDPKMNEELPIAELNVLLKFLQTLGALPKIELGDASTRGETLAVWRTAVEGQLRTTRQVVMDWWTWSYEKAEKHYGRWMKLPVLQRNFVTVGENMPRKFQTVEDWFFQDCWWSCQ